MKPGNLHKIKKRSSYVFEALSKYIEDQRKRGEKPRVIRGLETTRRKERKKERNLEHLGHLRHKEKKWTQPNVG